MYILKNKAFNYVKIVMLLVSSERNKNIHEYCD